MALQAALPPLQLAIAREVVDRAPFDLQRVGAVGAARPPDPSVLWLPLAGWIAAAGATFIAGQAMQLVAETLRGVAGDRLTGYVTEQLIQATNRWTGLARFEDPSFQDDLARARNQAPTGSLEVLTDGGRAALQLFTVVGLALPLAGLHPQSPLLLSHRERVRDRPCRSCWATWLLLLSGEGEGEGPTGE
jgi:ATP-binding cassette subfamily B protein